MNNIGVKAHKHIAFVEDHYNPLGLIRSLGEIGINPIVILVGNRPLLIPSCRYVGKLHKAKTITDGFDILLNKYGNEALKPFVYTCNDSITSFLDIHFNQLRNKFYCFNGAVEGHITELMNKDAINQLAIKCGCKIPKEEVVERGIFPTTLQYPVMTKAIDSLIEGWKSDSFICQNEDELKKAFTKIRSQRVLVQEFIVKKNELCLDGFSFNEGKDVFIPYQTSYIRFTPKSYGNYMYLKPMEEKGVFKQIQDILREAKFTGIFSVEYLVDQNDQFYFLEVNFRNSTWSYAFTRGGCNLPYLWAKATLEGKLDINDYFIRKEQFTAMVEVSDFKEGVISRKISFWDWMKDVKNCDCLFYYNKYDKKPLFAKLLTPIIRIFKV